VCARAYVSSAAQAGWMAQDGWVPVGVILPVMYPSVQSQQAWQGRDRSAGRPAAVRQDPHVTTLPGNPVTCRGRAAELRKS
jgi:hypothetical protein